MAGSAREIPAGAPSEGRQRISPALPDLLGAQEIYDPGHAAEVAWILPDEDPEEL